MKSIWDVGRLLFALGMAIGGAILLGLLAFHIFGLNAQSSLFLKILVVLPLVLFGIALTFGLLKLFERFRSKTKSEWDFWMIMLSFSLAGMFIMPVRMGVFHLLGFTAKTALWIKILVYIPLIPPAYYTGLLIIGTLLGQKEFFLGMIAKRIKFITGKKN